MKLKAIFLAGVSALTITSGAWANTDTDTSTSATYGVASQAAGVVVRVPVNAQGQLNSAGAQMRVLSTPASSTSALPSLWNSGTAVDPSMVGRRDGGVGRSMHGPYAFATVGWVNPSYYTAYQPYYSYGTYAYAFSYGGSTFAWATGADGSYAYAYTGYPAFYYFYYPVCNYYYN